MRETTALRSLLSSYFVYLFTVVNSLDSQSRFYLSSVVCKVVIVTDLSGCTTLPGPSLPYAGRVPRAGGEGVDGVWPSL